MIEFAITNLPFKVMDRTFISTFCITPFAFMVPSTSPYKSLKDAMEDAKKDPEHFTWISLGGTSGHDWLFRQFFKVAGVDVSKTQPVMVKGGTEAAAMVGGGHVKIGSSPIVSSRALAKSGALRYLAICRERNSEFPDVPTTAELGYPTINVATWVGFSGPPKLPSHIVDTWERTLKEIVKEPEFISRLAGIGSNVFYLDSAGMREFVKKQIEEIAELWGKKEK
jgi:tripartite-type tricarboxylate transporter receptor subunit TctC